MALSGKWFITPEGSVQLDGREHAQLATHYMLNLPLDRNVPMWWVIRGIPEEEFDAALKRGADPDAVEFLRKKGNDSRLWVLKLGWIRTAKSLWNLWRFDDKTLQIARDAKDYWAAQKITKSDYVDIEEFETRQVFSVPVFTILDGTDPALLKRVALGLPIDLPKEEVAVPSYAGRTERERRTLLRREGDNPRSER